MKKNKRVAALLDELVNNPNKMYDSRHFCDKFDIAKSSLSEDIKMVNEILDESGRGHIESSTGVGGGIKYIPGISSSGIKELQSELCEALSDSSRILGGGFLYTSDIMFNGHFVHDMARAFAQKFSSIDADYVVTVETKGIALAAQVGFLLNLPVVVIRREAKYSEGSTVSINYFSGSHDSIQRMSISKRAVKAKSKAIIIDDFMRGGGSIKGIEEILSEFDIEAVAVGVALVAKEPLKKKVAEYTSIITVEDIDEYNKSIKLSASEVL